MAGSVVGRERELAMLADLFAPDDVDGLRVATVTGEPGAGKSTLLDAVIARARDGRHLVLLSRPRAAEQDLGFSGLSDLLEGVPDLDCVDLPAPQRVALRRALLLEPSDATEAEPRAVAVALRSVLSHLARKRRVLVVVDDAHWLDAASSQVLGHAVRRLQDAQLSLLVASRPTEARQDWPSAGAGQRIDLELGGLSTAALFHLVRDRVGLALDRGSLHALEKASGGNPMYAVELARGLRGDHIAAGDDLRLTPPLELLVGRVVCALPQPTRTALLVAALARTPTRDVVATACGSTPALLDDCLAAAERADVARIDRGHVQFRHPLFAAAVVFHAAEEERRAVHGRVAMLDDDVESAARHTALATEGTDANVAAHVTAAAGRARRRGAHAAARELAALALDKTPGDDPADDERRLTLATWALHDGVPAVAQRVLARVAAGDGAARPQAHLLLAKASQLQGSLDKTRRHCDAVAACTTEPLLRAQALLIQAESEPDIADTLRHAITAQEVLDRAESGARRDAIAVQAMHLEAQARLLGGDPAAMHLLERAADLEQHHPPALVADGASFALAQQLLFSSRLGRARDILTHLVATARERGDEASEPILLLNLAHLETRLGRFDVARELAGDALVLAEVGGQTDMALLAAAQVAEGQSHAGDVDAAIARLDDCARRADEHGDPWLAAIVRSISGRVLLGGDQPQRAAGALQDAACAASAAGLIDPGWNPFPADLAEALVAAGEADKGEAELLRLEQAAAGLDRPHVDAVIPRVRAQILAADGRFDEAETLLAQSIRAQEELGQGFEIARTLLVVGRLHRRAKHKRIAHETLTRAMSEFERLGTPLWAGVARRELARVGRRPSAPATLTATEAHVATLAAGGRTNREIAGAIFVSPKTVEATLGRVYRKLGVRSRVELATALPDLEGAPRRGSAD